MVPESRPVVSDEAALSLDWFNLALAVPLVLVAMALSWWQRLGLGKSLFIGAVRATVQLLLIGQVLVWLFTTSRWYLVLAVLLVMVVAATLAATNRVEQIGSRMSLRFLCGAAILIGSALTMAYLDLVVVNIDPWYDPRYLIPIFGMIVGNAMNGAALAAERVRSEFETRRDEIEAGLALGASPAQASARAVRLAMTAALIPTINALAVVGIVSLPGMMTGQILAGADPTQAVHYQLIVMFMLTSATAITSVLVTVWYRKRFFTQAQQLIDLG
jgi:putative ABC transport system permease protein